jgi:shikimate kinase
MNVEYISQLLSKRQPYYEKAHALEIDTDGKTVEQITEEIIQKSGSSHL